MSLLNKELYNKMKYGTSDPAAILMLKSGVSVTFSKWLKEKYPNCWNYNTDKTGIVIKRKIIEKMIENNENSLNILETRFNASEERPRISPSLIIVTEAF